LKEPFPHRFTAVIRAVTGPFDAERTAEIKLELTLESPCQGELYVRVPVRTAARFVVGDHFSFKLTKID
jgi:hypothetical protein